MKGGRMRPWRSNRSALIAALFTPILFVVPFFHVIPALPQGLERPVLSVDDDCVAFAFSPDQRIVYAARHIMKTKHYDLERDDIWLTTPDGKKKRIVEGEKLVQSYTPFSYAIRAITWSPDGRRLTVAMDTEQVVDEKGTTREGELVDLMDDEGKEIKIAGTKDSTIEDASQAVWLGDGVTIAYLTEAVKPKLLFSIGAVRPAGGRGGAILEGHAYSAVAWDAKHNSAIGIERDRSLAGPPQLVQLDLLRETSKQLATLDGFIGQLTLSPSGSKVAYFRDGDTLEVRELSSPASPIHVPVAYGHYEWSPEEKRVLLKRGPENKSGDLVWVGIPDGNLQPVLHDLVFRDFAISPDQHWLGVTAPGKRILSVYPLP